MILHLGELYSTLHFSEDGAYASFLSKNLNSKEPVFTNLLDDTDKEAIDILYAKSFPGYFEGYIAQDACPYLYDKHILNILSEETVIKARRANCTSYALLVRGFVNNMCGGCNLARKSLSIKMGSKYHKIFSGFEEELKSYFKTSEIVFRNIEEDIELNDIDASWVKCDRCYYYYKTLHSLENNSFCDKCHEVITSHV